MIESALIKYHSIIKHSDYI